VESFESTLDSVYRADLVLLVVDASEPVETMREKLVTSHDTLYERNEAPVVTVFNKVDRLAPASWRTRQARRALGCRARSRRRFGKTSAGVAELRDRVEAELPDWERERLVLPSPTTR